MDDERILNDEQEEGRKVPESKLSALAVAIWRTNRRIQRADEVPDTVRLACEGIIDRLRDLGITWSDLIGEPYNENMRVQVVEKQGTHDLRIAECLSPAVYMDEQLIRAAEVVVLGKQ